MIKWLVLINRLLFRDLHTLMLINEEKEGRSSEIFIKMWSDNSQWFKLFRGCNVLEGIIVAQQCSPGLLALAVIPIIKLISVD